MTTKPNAAAFPLDCDTDPVRDITHHGLTKREYFAAMAMQGMGTWSPTENYSIPLRYNDALDARAEWAVRQADSLIKALNGEVKP